MRFVLASASPARLATLRAAGTPPEVIVSGVDEDDGRADSVPELVLRLAHLKAAAVAAGITGDAVVLGCDSLLELDGVALGKPGTAAAATARWRAMRGRSGHLHSGHTVISVRGGVAAASAGATASTAVRFANVSDDEIERYVGTGEPLAVAGAFTVDGLGGWFVESIDGDHHNVVGVSLPLLRHLLADLGLALSDIGYPSRD